MTKKTTKKKVSAVKSSRKELDTTHLDQLFDRGICWKTRSIQLMGTIGKDVDFDHIDSALTELERTSSKRITIKINSTGGDVLDALAIVGRMKSSRCKIITEAYGACMSAATLILAAGDQRKMSHYCSFMWHESSYVLGGAHTSVREEVEQMEQQEELWCHWMSELSRVEPEIWRSRSHKKNCYMSAEECLLDGVVDEVI